MLVCPPQDANRRTLTAKWRSSPASPSTISFMETVLRQLALYEPAGQEALNVLAAFQKLSSGSLLGIAQLMASLSGTPARILDPTTGGYARSHTGEGSNPSPADTRPEWPSAPILTGEPPALWLERDGDLRVLDAAILQAAAQATLSLRGTDQAVPEEQEGSLVDVLTAANPRKQEEAVGKFALHPTSQCRVVARPGNVAQILVSPPRGPLAAPDTLATALGSGERTGVSALTEARELPNAWIQAQMALAFAAAGTASDPGDSLVRFEDIGVWSDLVRHYNVGEDCPADVRAISALEDAPWAVQTLVALVGSVSVREAAARSFTHHSTMQARQAVLERRLGWNITTPTGRTRTAMALALRRYLLHPPSGEQPKSANPPVLFVSPNHSRVARP